MSGAALALVVAAAVLHAAWNALAKRGRNQLAFLWSSLTLASVLLGPAAAIRLLRESPAPGAWPFVGATILLHAVYFYALGRAYRSGAYSVVYPVARGLGVGLVPVVALAVFDERPSALGVGGIALVVAGIVGLHLAPRPSDRRGPCGPLRDLPLNRVAPAKPALEQGVSPALSLGSARAPGGRDAGAATRWALLTGVTIASYSEVADLAAEPPSRVTCDVTFFSSKPIVCATVERAACGLMSSLTKPLPLSRIAPGWGRPCGPAEQDGPGCGEGGASQGTAGGSGRTRRPGPRVLRLIPRGQVACAVTQRTYL